MAVQRRRSPPLPGGESIHSVALPHIDLNPSGCAKRREPKLPLSLSYAAAQSEPPRPARCVPRAMRCA